MSRVPAETERAPALPITLTTVAGDLDTAVTRIDALLLEKDRTKRGAWRGQPRREHLERLIAHAENALRLLDYGAAFDRALEEELTHMACRGLMVLTLALGDARGAGQRR